MRKQAVANETRIQLRRQLGLQHGVAVVFGLIVGSGIYLTPSGIIEQTGSPGLCLLVWAGAGLLEMMGALCMAELGTTFPQSGEKYTYLHQMYGPLAAFVYLWTYLVAVRSAANTIKIMALASSILKLVFPDCQVPEPAIKLLTVLISVLLIFMNCRTVKWSAHTQSFLTCICVIALSIISITGLVYLAQGGGKQLANAFDGTTGNALNIALALTFGIFAYGGGSAMNFMVEELENPYRNLPLSIIICNILVIILYIFVNMAYLVVLGPSAMIQSQSVAVTFSQRTLGPVAWIMTIFVCLNLASSYNSGLLVGSRLCFVAGRAGHLPKVLSLIHLHFLTPITSLILQLLLQIILVIVSDFSAMLRNVAFVNILFSVLVVCGMIKMRYTHPHLKRPFKVPLLMAVVYLVVMIFLMVMKLISYPYETLIGVVAVACTSIPAYVIFVRPKTLPGFVQRPSDWITTRVQKCLYCCPQDKDTFM